MNATDLAELAALLRKRNGIDKRIGRLINRPMTAGHAGEWIASRIFDIELESIAVAKAIDGRFRAGPLAGKGVNIKWYLKREGLLDMTKEPELDYYLVLTGPTATAKDVRTVRAWRIDAVYLFDAHNLLIEQQARDVKVGVASSVREEQWLAAEIYPTATNPLLATTKDQRHLLALFSGGHRGVHERHREAACSTRKGGDLTRMGAGLCDHRDNKLSAKAGDTTQARTAVQAAESMNQPPSPTKGK